MRVLGPPDPAFAEQRRIHRARNRRERTLVGGGSSSFNYIPGGDPMSKGILEPSVDVRRAQDRFSTKIGWLDSKHSFSFGQHHDPRNTHFGLLLPARAGRTTPSGTVAWPPPDSCVPAKELDMAW